MSSFAQLPSPSEIGDQNHLIVVDPSLSSNIPKKVDHYDLQRITPYQFKNYTTTSFHGIEGREEGKGLTCSLTKNQFLGTAHLAFDNHLGMTLNPSHLFLLILQQVALHVNQHAEELRSQFVHHTGKKKLLVEVPGAPSHEEWKAIIQTFQSQIASNTLPDTAALLTLNDFQSVSEVEKIAADVCLMDICQEFFDYGMMTMCGIPYFILEGPIEDWELLKEKTDQVLTRKTLPQFASRWKSSILPLLDKLIAARRGEEIDLNFWNNFYKRGARHGSGGYTFVNGWINAFFPLTNGSSFSPFCLPYNAVDINGKAGYDVKNYIPGVASAPVSWNRLGQEISMRFCSGFAGSKIIHQNCLRPEVAWWLGEVDEKKKK